MLVRRFRNAFLVTALGSLALASGSTACSGKKNTELVVAISTDMRIPKDLDAVTVEIFQNGRLISGDSYTVGPGGLHLPATIGIVPNDPANLNPIDVVITGQFGNSYPDDTENRFHVIRKARLTFAKDRVGLVRMPLRFSCYDNKGCDGSQTCVAGVCKSIPTIDGASLPEFSNELAYGSGANADGLGGNCWDPQKCLRNTVRLTEITPAPADGECAFALPGADVRPPDGIPDSGTTMGGDASDGIDASPAPADAGAGFKAFDATKPINVFILHPTLGFCDESKTCRVPLDQDPEEGWRWQDENRKDVIVLGRGLCTKVHAMGGGVEASDACETKVPTLPVCAVDGNGPIGGGGGGSDASVDTGGSDARAICTAFPSSFCKSDPSWTASDIDACVTSFADPGCASAGNAFIDCYKARHTCLSDGTTDMALLSEGCASELSAAKTCGFPFGASGADSGTGGGDASIDTGAPPTDGGASIDKCGVSDVSGGPPTTDPLLAGYTFADLVTIGTDMMSGPALALGGASPTIGSPAGSCPANEVGFTGSTYLQGNVPKLVSMTNGFTIGYYVNTGTSLPPNQVVLSTLTASSGFELGTNASGQPFGTIYFTGGAVTVTVPSSMPPAGWHHVVVQWNGVGQPVRAYIDGSPLATSSVPSGTYKPSTMLNVGRTVYPTVGKFLSLPIGDVRIYGH